MSADAQFPEPNPNLEYDTEYLELQAALRGKPEQQLGGKVVPAEEPDWDDVARRVEALRVRTHDLFVELAGARAEAHRHGLDGLAVAWQHLAGLLRAQWDTVHPQSDEDDGDSIRRLNILAALSAHEEGVSDLRAAVWIRVPGLGTCLVRQVEGGLGGNGVGADDHPIDRAQLAAFVRAAAAGGQPNSAQQGLDALRELRAVLVERVGEGRAIDLSPLERILRPIAEFHAAEAGWGGEAQPTSAAPSGGGPAAPLRRDGASGQVRVSSRQDVVRVLDEVCTYLEREEPTNPAPLLLRRAQRLMRMSFVDIVREMAPEGMDSVDKVLGPFPRRDE
jgi:type VI secretion system protein ImpA